MCGASILGLSVQGHIKKITPVFFIVVYKVCSEISSGGSLERSSEAMFVCPSVQAFWSLGARTAGPIGTGEYSFYAPSGGKIMTPAADRSVARGKCHVQSCKKLQKSCAPRRRPN